MPAFETQQELFESILDAAVLPGRRVSFEDAIDVLHESAHQLARFRVHGFCVAQFLMERSHELTQSIMVHVVSTSRDGAKAPGAPVRCAQGSPDALSRPDWTDTGESVGLMLVIVRHQLVGRAFLAA